SRERAGNSPPTAVIALGDFYLHHFMLADADEPFPRRAVGASVLDEQAPDGLAGTEVGQVFEGQKLAATESAILRPATRPLARHPDGRPVSETGGGVKSSEFHLAMRREKGVGLSRDVVKPARIPLRADIQNQGRVTGAGPHSDEQNLIRRGHDFSPAGCG